MVLKGLMMIACRGNISQSENESPAFRAIFFQTRIYNVLTKQRIYTRCLLFPAGVPCKVLDLQSEVIKCQTNAASQPLSDGENIYPGKIYAS